MMDRNPYEPPRELERPRRPLIGPYTTVVLGILAAFLILYVVIGITYAVVAVEY